MLKVHGSTKFLILDFMFLKSFFVFILDAIFCGTNLFIFRTVCGLLGHLSWCLQCCSIHKFTGLAIVAEATWHCGDFLFEKNCRHTTGNFSFFLVFTNRHSLSFHKFERQSCLFGLMMPCLLVDGTWERLIIDFSIFCGIISFYVSISDVVFLVTSFSILITVSDLYYHFDVLSFIHLSNLIGLVVVALANLRWSVFVLIKLSQIGSFH